MKKPIRLPTFEWFVSNASMISARHNDGCVRVLPNMVLNLAHFGRWALRDKAALRRLALR